MRQFVTIAQADVGRAHFQAFGDTWPTSRFIGRVLPGDVGKRAYLVGDILQVENEEQRTRREKGGGPVPSFVECGSCGAYHKVDFYGDCRDDGERFGPDQLDEQYGPFGWQEVKGGQS